MAGGDHQVCCCLTCSHHAPTSRMCPDINNHQSTCLSTAPGHVHAHGCPATSVICHRRSRSSTGASLCRCALVARGCVVWRVIRARVHRGSRCVRCQLLRVRRYQLRVECRFDRKLCKRNHFIKHMYYFNTTKAGVTWGDTVAVTRRFLHH